MSSNHPLNTSEESSECAVDEPFLKEYCPSSPNPCLASRSAFTQRSNAILIAVKLIFYASATVCLWVWSVSSSHHINISDYRQEVPHSNGKNVLYTGFGDGHYGLAEDISGQIPACKITCSLAIITLLNDLATFW